MSPSESTVLTVFKRGAVFGSFAIRNGDRGREFVLPEHKNPVSVGKKGVIEGIKET